MSKTTIFTGAGVAIVTPMNPDGAVNYEKYRELIDWQIENGTDAIITCGTTGESSTLGHEEHIAVMRTAVEQAAGRVPVISGTGSNDTAYCIELSKGGGGLGSRRASPGHAVLQQGVPKRADSALHRHCRRRQPADYSLQCSLPHRVEMKPKTIAELAKHPRIVGVKEANGNISAAAQVAALCDIDMYSGNDDQIVPLLSLGGKGVISVLSNILPRPTHDICAKWFAGDVQGSRDLQLQYLELANACLPTSIPSPLRKP